MNPGRFYMPRMGTNLSPMLGMGRMPSSGGLFSRIFGSLRGVNWSDLLNGANKTLNVVNQTIPLVRQAGPMFNNMRSMLRIAKAFGSETNNSNSRIVNNSQKNNLITNNNQVISNSENSTLNKDALDDNYPNFFV